MNTPMPQANNSNNTTLIIIAIIMGVATMMITHFYIKGIKEQVNEKMITVYRLRKAYDRGDKLKNIDLEPVKIPEKFSETLNFIIDELISNKIGKELKRKARQSEYVTADMFLSSTTAEDLKISPGNVAIAIPVDSRYAPGVIGPGMIVDISASFSKEGELPKVISVMQAINIIAVGRATQDSGSRTSTASKNITIEVTPKEAEDMLTVKQFVGREGFDITIRNPDDNNPTYVGVNTAVKKLVGLEK